MDNFSNANFPMTKQINMMGVAGFLNLTLSNLSNIDETPPPLEKKKKKRRQKKTKKIKLK